MAIRLPTRKINHTMHRLIQTWLQFQQAEDMVFGAPHAFYERKGDGYDDLVKSIHLHLRIRKV